MGTAEGITKVAQTAVEGLKSTPAILAVVLFNVLFIGALTFISVKNTARWDAEVERWAELVKSCVKVN